MMLIPPYVKMGAIAAGVLALFGAGFYFGTLSGRLDAANAKTAAEGLHAEQLGALATAWQERELQTQARDNRHDAELATLRTLRSGPLPGIALRLCPSAPGAVVSAAGNEGAQPAGAGALSQRNGQVPQGDDDQRPGLYAIADAADDLLAACRETQPVIHK
jgi:hypothetical protein